METPTASPNKQNEPRTQEMTGISVAYLLAPSIFFALMALVALYYAAAYTDMAKGTVATANAQKWEREVDQMQERIDLGEPEPTRWYLMGCVRKSNAIGASWQNCVVACAWSMRRTGLALLLGVVFQVYVVLRLRAHYKKLAAGAMTTA